MRRLVAMPKIVESEVSTRRQNASGIVSKDDARSIAHAEVFESRLQIRDQWKFIQRILSPFNQIVEPNKTRSPYVAGIDLASIATDAQDNKVTIF
jgi:hypothetical protein